MTTSPFRIGVTTMRVAQAVRAGGPIRDLPTYSALGIHRNSYTRSLAELVKLGALTYTTTHSLHGHATRVFTINADSPVWTVVDALGVK